MWRCPHCGTPQAETARCWVCRRSSTACGTCRNFRRAVAGSFGYCGIDRRRQPLGGNEIRACWEAGPGGTQTTIAAPLAVPRAGPTAAPRHAIEFVEVDGGPAVALTAAGESAVLPPDPILPTTQDPGWSLWGDTER